MKTKYLIYAMMYAEIELDKRFLCIVSDKTKALDLIDQLDKFHIAFGDETAKLQSSVLDQDEDLATMDLVIDKINFPNEIVPKIYCNLFYKGYDKNCYEVPELDTFYDLDQNKSWFLIEEVMEIE